MGREPDPYFKETKEKKLSETKSDVGSCAAINTFDRLTALHARIGMGRILKSEFTAFLGGLYTRVICSAFWATSTTRASIRIRCHRRVILAH